jgi:eukaryotic-like serine/threonine-protein kinase
VFFGRLLGAGGFTRTVAIKHLDPRWAAAHGGARELLRQTRALTRVRHPNVVPTLDAVEDGDQLFLVTEYVPGETLDRLLAPLAVRGERVPPRIACALVAGVLRGLQAAHEAKSSRGEPLGIVHGDVAPRNVLVGADGTPRILDFAFARPAPPYMAPEQARGETTSSTDVFAAGMILWEALTGRSALSGAPDAVTLAGNLVAVVEPPSKLVLGVPREVDVITMLALKPDPRNRYASAKDMARDLEACIGGAADSEIAAWVLAHAGPELERRAAAVAEIERDGAEPLPPLPPIPFPPRPAPPSGPPRGLAPPQRPGASFESTAGGRGNELGIVQLLAYAFVGFALVSAIGFALLVLRAAHMAREPEGVATPTSVMDAARD